MFYVYLNLAEVPPASALPPIVPCQRARMFFRRGGWEECNRKWPKKDGISSRETGI